MQIKNFQKFKQVEELIDSKTIQSGADMYETDIRCGEEGRAVIPREAAGFFQRSSELTKLWTAIRMVTEKAFMPILCQPMYHTEKVGRLVPALKGCQVSRRLSDGP